MTNYWRDQQRYARFSLIMFALLAVLNYWAGWQLLTLMATASLTSWLVLREPARRGERQAALLELTRSQLVQTLRRKN